MRDVAEALSCRSSLGATVAGLLVFFSSNATFFCTKNIRLSFSDLLPEMQLFFCSLPVKFGYFHRVI